MEAPLENSALEIKRLQRCINDLVSVLALPAMWTGAEPARIVHTLLDSLPGMLDLDLAYVRVKARFDDAPDEMLRVVRAGKLAAPESEIAEALDRKLEDDPQRWPPRMREVIGGTELTIAALPLGLQSEIGVIVAGSQRANFPQETERLLLSVAANQVAIGLQEAWLLSEQKRATDELDRRVAQRTAELAATNAELRAEIGERKKMEERLRESESALEKALAEIKKSEARMRQVVDAIPTLAWCNLPDGPNEFLNKGWHEYTGLSHEESDGWGWQVAIHPEDLPPLLKKWGEWLITGERGEIEARLRRHDGVFRWFLIRVAPFRDEAGEIIRWYGTSTDIQERKQAEQALHEALRQVERGEERWRSVFENSAVGVALADLTGRFLATNPVYEKMLGYTEEELQQLSFLDITTEEHHQANATLVEELLAGTRRQFQLEKQYRRKNGSLMWVRASVSLVPGSERMEQFLMALSEDITERKEAEEALRASQRDLTSIINTVPTLAWSTFPDGYCDFTNQSWREYTGLTAERGRGWGWGAAIHPDDVDGLTEYWRSCLASGTPVDTEARMRRFDGTYRWFLFRANPLRDESGKIVKWYGTNTDIDDRKRAEHELQRKEEFLAEAQRVSLTGSFSWSVDTDEITFSEQLYRIFEFEPNSAVTLARIATRIHPEDIPLLSDKVELARNGVTDLDYEIRLRMPDGRIKYLRTDAYGSRDAAGALEYLGAIQDVTERRLSEEALGKVRSELAHIARVTSLGELTASIAHEVNQPLSGIITNASTCLRMLAADPPNIDGALETTRRTIRDGNRASEVITRLRALYSKKEASPEAMDLNEATREVLALSLSELQRERVVLRQELQDDLPVIIGDRVQLQQVILNLLRNASDAMSRIEDRPREMVIRTEREEGNRVRLVVQDAGVGFDPRAMNEMFEAFYTTKHNGMGMGLSVSRSIIESHQGSLSATLNDGPGATFSFSIPCAFKGVTRADSAGAG